VCNRTLRPYLLRLSMQMHALVLTQKVRELLEGLTANMKVRSITVTGHSLGGALTTLCACDIGEWLRDNCAVLGPNPPLCNAVTWASPRVGVRAHCPTPTHSI